MDQLPLNKPANANTAGPPPTASHPKFGEALVYLIFPMVAVAVTLVLQLQLEVPMSIATSGGMLVALLLITVHGLRRQAREITSLRSEIAKLGAPQRLEGPRASGQPRAQREQKADASIIQAARPAMIDRSHPPAASRAGNPGSAPGASEMAHGRVPLSPGPQPGWSQQHAAGAQHLMTAPPPLPGMIQPIGGERMVATPPPMFGAAKSTSDSVPQPSLAPPALSVPLTASQAVATPATGNHNEASMAPYWDLRPGVAREPMLGPGRLPSISALPMPPKPADPSDDSDVKSEGRPNDRELEVMHNLIEQLAVQLNSPTQVPAVAPSSGEDANDVAVAEKPSLGSVTTTLVESSVAALKATAEAMRGQPALRASQQEIVAATSSENPTAPDAANAPGSASERKVDGADSAAGFSRLAVITEAIAAQRIDVYLDPIHGLSDRKAKHFEVSIRVRSSDRESLSREDFGGLALGTGLLPKLDAAKLARSVRVAERLRSRGTPASLFSNIAGESLTDEFFLDAFEVALGDQDNLPNRLVLSFTQADVRTFADVHWDAILTMSEIGIRFAVEEVTDLDMDFAELKAHGFEFVKLDAQVFLEGLPTSHGSVPSTDICRHLSSMRLGLIVGRIEDERTMATIMGFGVVLGQGTLFGGARPVVVDMSSAPNVVAA